MNKKRGFLLLTLAFLVLFPLEKVSGFEESARSKKSVWSGYWWPMRRGEIIEPLTKYDQRNHKQAAEWEKTNNPSGPDVPQWFGYCHAWSASAILEKEPVNVLQAGPHQLSVGDQKGLLAASHTEDSANFYGMRYEEGGDFSDIEPTELWKALKIHIKEQGVPIVADIEPGEPVWNYPIYAYRVRMTPQGDKGTGTIEIWFADDAVGKDFVGLKSLYKQYTFELALHDGVPVMGSGKWTGKSVKDHPDFLWYPYVAKAENPELDYALVRKMMQLEPLHETETEPEYEPEAEQEPEPEPVPAIGPAELTALIANQQSDFLLDITLDKYDGGIYQPGEKITIFGTSEKEGYLYLIGISPKGTLTMLYPQNGDQNRIQANAEFSVPGPGVSYSFSIANLPGLYRVKAFVTDKPLVLAGWDPETSEPERTNSGSVAVDRSNFRWNPTTAELTGESIISMWEERTNAPGETVKKRFKLTRFAQDEAAFVVKKPRNYRSER